MSLLLSLHGEKKTILAADSRGCDSHGFGHDDAWQKLFRGGVRTAVATVGISELLTPDGPISISGRIAALASDDRYSDSPMKLLHAAQQSLTPLLKNHFAPGRCALPNDAGILDVIATRRERDGRCYFLHLAWPVVSGQLAEPQARVFLDKQPMSAGQCAVNAFGLPECLAGGVQLKRNPDSVSDREILADIDRIFSAAAKHPDRGNEIGGPVDCAVIDADGFRWLRRKAVA